MSLLQDFSEEVMSIAESLSANMIHISGKDLPNRSGFWVEERKIITTAAAAEEGESVEVLAHDNSRITVTVRGYDSRTGIVLLEAPENVKNTAAVPWKGHDPVLGEAAVTLAYPSPAGPEVRLDLVRFADAEYAQGSGAPFPGFEGAALVSADKSLLGIVARNEYSNHGWILPYSRLRKIVDRLWEEGSTRRRSLGVKTKPVKNGLLVTEVMDSSAAEKAGVLVGDILTALDGSALEDVFSLLRSLDSGSGSVSLELLRGGNKLSLTCSPDESAETYSRLWHGVQGGRHSHCCR